MKAKNIISEHSDCGIITFMSLLLKDTQNIIQGKGKRNDGAFNYIRKKNDVFRNAGPTGVKNLRVLEEQEQIFSFCSNVLSSISIKDLCVFMDNINNGKSGFWEKVTFNSKKSTFRITGRKELCNYIPAQAGCQEFIPICDFCCKGLLRQLFSSFVEKDVNVIQHESATSGRKRCSFTVFID